MSIQFNTSISYYRGGWDFASDLYTYTGNNGYLFPPGAQLGNLAWTVQILWTHYHYTQNTTMLRTLIYPMLRMSNNYYMIFSTSYNNY